MRYEFAQSVSAGRYYRFYRKTRMNPALKEDGAAPQTDAVSTFRRIVGSRLKRGLVEKKLINNGKDDYGE